MKKRHISITKPAFQNDLQNTHTDMLRQEECSTLLCSNRTQTVSSDALCVPARIGPICRLWLKKLIILCSCTHTIYIYVFQQNSLYSNLHKKWANCTVHVLPLVWNWILCSRVLGDNGMLLATVKWILLIKIGLEKMTIGYSNLFC